MNFLKQVTLDLRMKAITKTVSKTKDRFYAILLAMIRNVINSILMRKRKYVSTMKI